MSVYVPAFLPQIRVMRWCASRGPLSDLSATITVRHCIVPGKWATQNSSNQLSLSLPPSISLSWLALCTLYVYIGSSRSGWINFYTQRSHSVFFLLFSNCPKSFFKTRILPLRVDAIDTEFSVDSQCQKFYLLPFFIDKNVSHFIARTFF